MKLTKEQFALLSEYEKNMETALHARWARNPGRRPLEIMADIWRKHSYSGFRMDFNCSTCIVNLLSDVGRIYFADKAELIAAEKAKAQEAEIRISPDTGDYHPEEYNKQTPKKVGTTIKAKTVKKKTVKTAQK